MLKGTMKIELTDVNTGKTETVLEQNMVTNQLSNIFRHMGYCKDPDKLLTDWAPHYKTLLGGLLLGVIEIFAKAYISTQVSDAIVFAVLIIVLLVKPTGLLGKQIREKV